MQQEDILTIGNQFCSLGKLLCADSFGNGNINDTWLAVYEKNGKQNKILHQRINHNVFVNPADVMENMVRVTTHLRKKVEEEKLSDGFRRVIHLVKTRDGNYFYQDDNGNYWRTQYFVDGVHTLDIATSPEQAFQGGFAFGQFQSRLSDLPLPELKQTIPNFHNLAYRYQQMDQAIAKDSNQRLKQVAKEIELAESCRHFVETMRHYEESGKLKRRVVHNDTKLNNLLLDDATGEAICVIDLDTVMTGSVINDFGDLVRTTVSRSAEDSNESVEIDLEMFKALTRGYMSSAEAFLTGEEKDLLAVSGVIITLELAIRFLTDFLSGDTYFKIKYPMHNLDRCRNQFLLTHELQNNLSQMEDIVAST